MANVREVCECIWRQVQPSLHAFADAISAEYPNLHQSISTYGTDAVPLQGFAIFRKSMHAAANEDLVVRVWCERRENALRCSADIFAEVGEGADVSTVVVADGPAAAFPIDREDVGEPDAIDRWIDTVIAFTLANRDLAIRSLR